MTGQSLRGRPGFSQRLIISALIRIASSDHVYLSNRQSMSIKVYMNTLNKRAKTSALLDSGATENFISTKYAQWLDLPIQKLEKARTVCNVDGTESKQGAIMEYVDLEIQTGQERKRMCFFLTDLGDQKIILGYPWFATTQP